MDSQHAIEIAGKLKASSWILLLTLLISILAIAFPPLKRGLMFRPQQCWVGKGWHTLLSSGFVHADFNHLFGNMLSFWFFAFVLEDSYLGFARFLVLYLSSIVLANLWSLFRHRSDATYATLGASGAISAVIFSMVIFEPTRELVFYFPVPIPAVLYAVLYVGWSIWSSLRSKDNINHMAHLWGGVAGIALTCLLHPEAWGKLKALPDILQSYW